MYRVFFFLSSSARPRQISEVRQNFPPASPDIELKFIFILMRTATYPRKTNNESDRRRFASCPAMFVEQNFERIKKYRTYERYRDADTSTGCAVKESSPEGGVFRRAVRYILRRVSGPASFCSRHAVRRTPRR